MELTKNRMLHSLAVAKTMKEITEKRYPEDQELAQEMFILGLLHDIGYEFCEDEGEDHAKIGGDILRHQGYPYWKAVYFHGIPEKVYDTESLEILNTADLLTGPNGENFTPQERLNDVANRYGFLSNCNDMKMVILNI